MDMVHRQQQITSKRLAQNEQPPFFLDSFFLLYLQVSSIILGTEAKQLLFLDANCSSIETAVSLPSVPTHIAVSGVLNVDHRVHVACRDGVIYTVRNRQLLPPASIESGALPVGIVRTDMHLWVGTVDAQLFCYNHTTGKKVWSTPLPSPITSMERMCVRKADISDCCCVGLEGGLVKVYNVKACVASLSLPDTATAIRFGQYSREMNSLAVIGRSGYLHIKMTKRTASFKPGEQHPHHLGAAGGAGGAIPEQDIPLAIPKKTRVYLENTQREKEHALEMHRVFQRDLTKLRLTTARAFVKTISDGGSALATLTGASLRLNATVAGLGPNFKIKLELSNVGTAPAMDVHVFFAFKLERYLMPQASVKLPLLVPGNRCNLEFPCICVDPSGAADSIRCVVVRGGSRSASSIVPSINAVINMPMSQPLIPV
jgi:Bardet-Biedl syndrome 1 protein